MPEAYIVDAVRTPGRASAAAGSPASIPPTSARTPSARSSAHRRRPGARSTTSCSAASTRSVRRPATSRAPAGWSPGSPTRFPGTTVDRQCGSSQQAVHFAAQAVMSGTADLVVAGGVQNMSAIPICAAMLAGEQYGFADPFARLARLGGALRHPGGVAVPLGRDDRREVEPVTRGDGGLRHRVPRARAPRPRRGPLRTRDRAARRRARSTRGRANPTLEKIRSLPHARGGRPAHRRGARRRSPTRRRRLLDRERRRP